MPRTVPCARRRRVALALASLPVVGLPVASGAADAIAIVHPAGGAGALAAAQALKRRLPAANLVDDTAVGSLSQLTAPVIAVGPAALRAVTAAPPAGPILAVFTTREDYERITAEARGAQPRRFTAIYAEAPPAAQIALIAALYAQRVKVGVLVPAQGEWPRPELQRAAAEAGFQLAVEPIAKDANLSRSLLAIEPFNLLLAVPDGQLYTPESLRGVLETTYRRGRPVIGFSQSMVSAGCLAGAYASADDIAAHAAQVIAQLTSATTPGPQYPRYWRVAVNENVARSFGITIDERISNLGNKPPASTP